MKRLSKEATDRVEGLTNTIALNLFKTSINVIIQDMVSEGWEHEDVRDYMFDTIESKIEEHQHQDKEEDWKQYWVFESC